MAKFWLDGVCSKDMGIELQNPVKFSGASPKVSTVTVDVYKRQGLDRARL